jgi:hypothetical protein
LICLDARASTESSSTIILTTTWVNIGVGGIVLAYSFVTGEPVKKSIEGTYSKEEYNALAGEKTV